MTPLFDEFSKSLDESVPRRQTLRLLGAALAGAVFSPLGFGTAWGARPDPCKAFCRCSNKAKQNQCLAACKACSGNTSRLAGSCGNYVCCSKTACGGVCSDLLSDPNCGACGNDCGAEGEVCCGNYCADLANDFDNCGRCGAKCAYPGQYEDGACVDGHCHYWCVAGAIDCNGICAAVDSDPNNCGACGHVCPSEAPFCTDGTCAETYCNGADLLFDATNCGACGHQCQPLEFCSWGACYGYDYGYDYGY